MEVSHFQLWNLMPSLDGGTIKSNAVDILYNNLYALKIISIIDIIIIIT
jgi:hypothetical protein